MPSDVGALEAQVLTLGSRAWSPVACDCPGVGTIIDPRVPLYPDRIGTGSLAPYWSVGWRLRSWDLESRESRACSVE